MIAEIIADVHLFHLPVLILHLEKYVFEEVVVVLLHLHVGDRVRDLGGSGGVLRIAITVLKDDGLRESRLVVKTGTGSAVARSPDFEVERTVDFVLLRPENRG